MPLVILCTILLITSVFCIANNVPQDKPAQSGQKIKDDDVFKALFKLKHSDQANAVRAIVSMGDYAKQFKMVQMVLDKMVQVMGQAKVLLENSGYIAGNEFPSDEKVREALATTLENTALFSEILLHLPDITHRQLAKLEEHRSLFHWSIFFCNETDLIDATTRKLLTLAAQELDLIPRDPNYVNPYRLASIKQTDFIPQPEEDAVKKPKKRKTRTKGPQLSNVKHIEL